jgi:WD40 repeat protein
LPPQNALELSRVLAFFERAARALHAAHEAGVVHRDVKPGNLMVDPEGEPVVLDFGQARELESAEQPLTHSGDVFGTPSFMSPEQVRGETKALDRQTDVWSLGASLYECLTLARPFQGANVPMLLEAIVREPLPAAREKNALVGDELSAVLATALEKDRARRYASALEFAEDLRRLREYEPIRARSPSAWLVFRRWVQRHPALAAVTIGLIVTLAGGLAWTLYLLQREEHALRYGTGRYLAERAIDLLGEDPAAALIVGVDAVERAPTYQTRAALFAALDACRLERPLVTENRRMLDIDASPDGTRALTAVDDGTAIVWDLATGKPLFTTEKHPGPVERARYLGAGGTFATLTSDERVRFFDASDGSAAGWISTRAKPIEFAASADGEWLVLLDANDRTVSRWNVRERQLSTFQALSLDAPRHLGISADAQRAAVWPEGPPGEHLEAYDLVDFTLDQRQHRPVFGDLRTVALEASGERVLETTAEGRAQIVSFDPRPPDVLATMDVGAEITAAAWSRDGKLVALGTRQDVRLWNLDEDRCLPFRGAELERTIDLAFSPDGSRLAAATLGNAVRLFDVATLARSADCVAYLQPARVTWTPDGTRVLAQNNAHTAYVWFGANRPDVYSLTGHAGPLTAAHFDRQGERVVTTSLDGTARLWSTPARPSLAEAGRLLGVLDHHGQAVLGAAFAPDGERVLTFGADGRARIWNATTLCELAPAIAVEQPIVHAEFDARGGRVVALDAGGHVWLGDASTEGIQVELGSGGARAAHFSRDAELVLVGHADGTLAEWRAADRSLVCERAVTDAHGAPVGVSEIAFASTKPWLAVACDDTRARFFELGRVDEVRKPVVFFAMQSLAFGCSDTRVLATGPGGRGAMKMWDLERESGLRPEVYHSDDLTGGVFDARGRFFATISQDGSAYVRETSDGRPFVHLELHRGAIVAAEFSPNEPLRLLTASVDGTARISPVDPLPSALARAPRGLYDWELAREQRLAAPLTFR